MRSYIANILYTELNPSITRHDLFYFTAIRRDLLLYSHNIVCNIVDNFTRCNLFLEVELSHDKYSKRGGRNCKNSELKQRLPVTNTPIAVMATTPRIYRGANLVLIDINVMHTTDTYNAAVETYTDYIRLLLSNVNQYQTVTSYEVNDSVTEYTSTDDTGILVPVSL